MYLLMTLRMPFYDEDDRKNRKITLEKPVDLDNELICYYSEDARYLIGEML